MHTQYRLSIKTQQNRGIAEYGRIRYDNDTLQIPKSILPLLASPIVGEE